MTAVTARAAGVQNVWVASPRPSPVTLGAAFIAKADAVLAVGGAQAIGALAYGVGEVDACDIIVGPGNKWVTAAKSLIAGICAIDMLAGPSEVLVIADHTGDAQTIAADLLAQAEHDPEARPILVATSRNVIDQVNKALVEQLAVLPTGETARAAVRKGFAVEVASVDEAVAVSDKIAPEHLEVQVEGARTWPSAARTTGQSSSATGRPRCWVTTARAPTTCSNGRDGALHGRALGLHLPARADVDEDGRPGGRADRGQGRGGAGAARGAGGPRAGGGEAAAAGVRGVGSEMEWLG